MLCGSGSRTALVRNVWQDCDGRGVGPLCERGEGPAPLVRRLCLQSRRAASRKVAILFDDITEKRGDEEALRESEERYHRLFEDDLTGDFISTPEGRILLCNPAFAAIFGFSLAQDAVGTNILDLYLDPREREPLLERLKREGKIDRFEGWRKRRDGEPIYIVENLVGHVNDRGELHEIKGYIFDDTERKRAEQALRARSGWRPTWTP